MIRETHEEDTERPGAQEHEAASTSTGTRKGSRDDERVGSRELALRGTADGLALAENEVLVGLRPGDVVTATLSMCSSKMGIYVGRGWVVAATISRYRNHCVARVTKHKFRDFAESCMDVNWDPWFRKNATFPPAMVAQRAVASLNQEWQPASADAMASELAVSSTFVMWCTMGKEESSRLRRGDRDAPRVAQQDSAVRSVGKYRCTATVGLLGAWMGGPVGFALGGGVGYCIDYLTGG